MPSLVRCGNLYVSATVFDISLGGAQIYFLDNEPCEPVRSLFIPRLKSEHRCKSIWRRPGRVGVEFESAPISLGCGFDGLAAY